MPRYHGLMLSPNISTNAEGYLICQNVPLCRSGFQEYKGKELVGFDGYQEDWGLDPETIYKVFRPKDEVLAPEFIASLEGKTVVDEHPDGNVVHVDNDGELNCGHVERVTQGPDLNDGEVTLQGDLIIKNPDLIQKIRPDHDPDNQYDTAVRDVSCGYGLKLKRLKDETLVMYQLRGNHVAVVEKGRAGPRIAIKDSAPPEIKSKKEIKMSLKQMIFGLGLKTLADASPEELASVTKEMEKEDSPRTEVDKKAKDAEPKSAHHAACHECLDRCMDARMDKDHMGVDGFGKPKHLEDLKKELMQFLTEEEGEASHQGDADLEELEKEEEKSDAPKGQKVGDEELEQEEKTAAEEDDETKAVDGGEKAEKEIDDPGTSVLKAANDSVRDYIKSTRPIVAVIAAKPRARRTAHEQTMVDSYNTTVRSLNKTASSRAYAALSVAKKPKRMAADSVVKSDAEIGTCTCFDGVTFKVGTARHEAKLCQKGNK